VHRVQALGSAKQRPLIIASLFAILCCSCTSRQRLLMALERLRSRASDSSSSLERGSFAPRGFPVSSSSCLLRRSKAISFPLLVSLSSCCSCWTVRKVSVCSSESSRNMCCRCSKYRSMSRSLTCSWGGSDSVRHGRVRGYCSSLRKRRCCSKCFHVVVLLLFLFLKRFLAQSFFNQLTRTSIMLLLAR
jgi:hypothetical protein